MNCVFDRKGEKKKERESENVARGQFSFPTIFLFVSFPSRSLMCVLAGVVFWSISFVASHHHVSRDAVGISKSETKFFHRRVGVLECCEFPWRIDDVCV